MEREGEHLQCLCSTVYGCFFGFDAKSNCYVSVNCCVDSKAGTYSLDSFAAAFDWFQAFVAGLTWADIYQCVKWMAPFAKAILEVGQSPVKFFKQVPAEDCHNIQAHNVGLALLVGWRLRFACWVCESWQYCCHGGGAVVWQRSSLGSISPGSFTSSISKWARAA